MEDFRLRVFDTVARLGNFSAAARELGITQPAVSQHIAELEKIGGRLFNRNRGSVTLTPKGEQLRRCSDQILHWYDVAERVLTGDGAGESEPVIMKLDDGKALEISSSLGTVNIKLL